MFRVAVHGLEKGVLPVSGHGEAVSLRSLEDPFSADPGSQNELIKPRLVPIDSKLKHHFEREYWHPVPPKCHGP